MRLLGKILRWTAIVVAATVVVAAVALSIVIRTAPFREFVRTQAESYFAGNYRGRLTIERLRGSVLGSLELSNVALSYDGKDVARVRTLDVRYRLLPLLYGTFSVRRLEVLGLKLDAVETRGQRWNLLEAVSERNPSPVAAGPALRVLLRKVRLRDADVNVTLADGRVYRLAGASIDGRVKLLATGVVADLSSLSGRLGVPKLPPSTIDASFAYQDAAAPASLRIRRFKLATAHSTLDLAGRITNLEKLAVDATVKVSKLAGRDLVAIVPRLSESVDLSGTVRLTGERSDLHVVLAMQSGGAKVLGDLDADLSRSPLGYRATLELANVDVARLLAVAGYAGVLNGSVQMVGAGAAPASLKGRALLRVSAPALGGWRFGELALSTEVSGGKARFDAEMSDGRGGSALASGEVGFVGTPAYQLSLRVKRLGLATVEPAGLREHGVVDFTASVEGKGIRLAAMEASASVDWHQSTLGRIRIDRGELRARISKGNVEIARASLEAGSTRATAQGVISIAGERRGEFSYRLHAPDVAPWLELAGYSGAGSLDVDGSATGWLTDLSVRGKLAASSFRFAGARAGRAQADYSLSGIGQGIPYGSLKADFATIKAGVELRSARLAVEIARGRPVAAKIALDAVDSRSQAQKLAAALRYDAGVLDGELSELSLDMPDGKWRLARTSMFHYDSRQASVSNLALVSNDKRITIDGAVTRGGALNLLLAIQKLDLANVDAFVPGRYGLGGVLTAEVRMTGTAMAPTLVAQADLNSPRMRGVSFASLSANLNYSSGVASFRMTARQDAAHKLEADGRLPMQLEWNGRFEARPTGPVSAHISSKALDLALLKYVDPRLARDIQGKLAVEIALDGPLDRPTPSGGIWLWDAKAQVRPLGVRLASLSATLSIGPQAIHLKDLYARSGDGTLDLWGTAGLDGYRPERFTVTARFQNWPAIDTSSYKAHVGGLLLCTGTPDAPRVEGRVEVLRATIRPEISFLEGSSALSRDPTIVVIRPGAPAAEEPSPSDLAATRAWRNLAVNVQVSVRRDTWIKHRNSYAELQGQVHALKQPLQPLTLIGSIQTVRGSIEVAQEPLKLTEGRIYFTGGVPIDPSLNVVARRDVNGYAVYAVIAGTVSKPTLAFRSEPELPQADVLSMLMFGRPVTNLGQSQQVSVQQQAVAIAGSFAANTVGQSVAQALGLGALQFSVEAGRAAVGKYITQDIYVSASQSIAPPGPQNPGQEAQKASIRYYITPHFDLETSTSRTASQIDLNWHTQY